VPSERGGARASGPANPLAGWQVFGLPAFATALAPWYNKLVDAALIPEWYEPPLKIVATILGPFICFLLWLTCSRLGHRRLVRLAYGSLILFLVALAACLGLMFTVDVVWFPGETMQLALRLIWPAAYLTVFAAFSAGIVSGLLLANRPAKRSSGR
jgi:hypothetical protein